MLNVTDSNVDVFGLELSSTERHLRSLPRPQATDTWHPLAHNEFISMVEDQMAERGMIPTSKRFTSTAADERIFGTYVIDNYQSDRGDSSLMLGLRHSTNKTLPAALAIGHHVFVCSNGMFTGEFIIGRRHTKNIMDDLPGMIATQLDRFPTAASLMFEYNEHLRRQSVTADEFTLLARRMFEVGALPKSKVMDVIDEYRSDEHEAKHGVGTAWSALNAATEILKPRLAKNSIEGSEQTLKLHRLFEDCFPLDRSTRMATYTGEVNLPQPVVSRMATYTGEFPTG
jgi:hypothetical protein